MKLFCTNTRIFLIKLFGKLLRQRATFEINLSFSAHSEGFRSSEDEHSQTYIPQSKVWK